MVVAPFVAHLCSQCLWGVCGQNDLRFLPFLWLNMGFGMSKSPLISVRQCLFTILVTLLDAMLKVVMHIGLFSFSVGYRGSRSASLWLFKGLFLAFDARCFG